MTSVHIHGHVEITTPAQRALMTAQVPVAFFSQGSWYYGRSGGHEHKNVMVRIQQYAAAADPDRSLALAQRFVVAKIRNCRVLLRRNGKGDLQPALIELDKALQAVPRARSLASLLGMEGNAARVYFSAFSSMLKDDADLAHDFTTRNRRPPRDPVNALLSLSYSLLTSAWSNTLSAVGLDPYLGFFHQPKYGRPALALDMMEEFRPLIADSVVINCINRAIVRSDDFIRRKTGVSLSPAARKRVIAAFERRLDEQLTHPVFGYRMSYRRIMAVQARLLGRHLLGEIKDFPELKPR